MNVLDYLERNLEREGRWKKEEGGKERKKGKKKRKKKKKLGCQGTEVTRCQQFISHLADLNLNVDVQCRFQRSQHLFLLLLQDFFFSNTFFSSFGNHLILGSAWKSRLTSNERN